MIDAVVFVHAVATAVMTGLIWFVQIVHYPLFAAVGRDAFARYEAAHQTRTTWVVAPTMLVEVGSAIWLVYALPHGRARELALVGLGLAVVIWLSTAFLQARQHAKLSAGFDETIARRLVATNWIRTVAWSARLCIALELLRRTATP